MPDEAMQLAGYAARVLPLSSAQLSEEYYYQSLPLCVIDAVFSIGVRYGAVQRVVSRYCQRFRLMRVRHPQSGLPPREEQESITSLCERFAELGFGEMTESVFDNRQRTSPRNGILKSEAVLEFADVLRSHGVEYFQDVPAAMQEAVLEQKIRQIPGQGSGISLSYLWMLAGSDESVKPDRMVVCFLENALGRPVRLVEAQPLLSQAAALLQDSFPGVTPRLLDNEIWKLQRQVAGNKA